VTGSHELLVGPERGATRELPGPPSSCAVLVVDIQRSFADPADLAANGIGPDDRARVGAAVTAVTGLVDAARQAGAHVVWIELAQRAEAPWLASAYFRQREPGEPGACMAGTPGAEWFGVEPGVGEPIVSKRRYSGFVGTDLHQVLQSLGVTWVVPCGLTTECCVESTARDAFQLDYPVIVPQDATAAYRLADHDRALELLALNFALVTDVGGLAAAWGLPADDVRARGSAVSAA
jgi:nicotinamidase-related amidase